MQNSDFMQHMGDTFKHVAMPALALGAGTGALSGFMSSGAQPGETSRDRRHRVLKNAIIGAALGTTAGIGLPMGYEALNTPLHAGTAGPVEGTVDKVLGLGMSHPALVGGGIGAGIWGRHVDLSSRRNAAETLRSKLQGQNPEFRNTTGSAAGTANLHTLASRPGTDTQPSGAEELMRKFREGVQGSKPGEGDPADMGSIFRSNELMQEAGHKGMSLADMKSIFEKKITGQAMPDVRAEFLNHIGSTGMVGSALKRLAGGPGGRLPGADMISKVPGLGGASTFDSARLAEMYSKYFRPSVSEAMGPSSRLLPAPLRWGLLGAGVLGANEIQKRITGD